jgi:hypothetical protein
VLGRPHRHLNERCCGPRERERVPREPAPVQLEREALPLDLSALLRRLERVPNERVGLPQGQQVATQQGMTVPDQFTIVPHERKS